MSGGDFDFYNINDVNIHFIIFCRKRINELLSEENEENIEAAEVAGSATYK